MLLESRVPTMKVPLASHVQTFSRHLFVMLTVTFLLSVAWSNAPGADETKNTATISYFRDIRPIIRERPTGRQ